MTLSWSTKSLIKSKFQRAQAQFDFFCNIETILTYLLHIYMNVDGLPFCIQFEELYCDCMWLLMWMNREDKDGDRIIGIERKKNTKNDIIILIEMTFIAVKWWHPNITMTTIPLCLTHKDLLSSRTRSYSLTRDNRQRQSLSLSLSPSLSFAFVRPFLGYGSHCIDEGQNSNGSQTQCERPG